MTMPSWQQRSTQQDLKVKGESILGKKKPEMINQIDPRLYIHAKSTIFFHTKKDFLL